MRRARPDGIAETVAGTGVAGYSGDGGPANRAQLGRNANHIAIGADGSLFIADNDNRVIRRVSPDGIITTFWRDVYATYLATGSDGSLYLVTPNSYRVHRITPDGRFLTVAGNGSYGDTGDGGLAIQAPLAYPQAIAVGPDGAVYIGNAYGRIRRVGPDGIISAFAGGGTGGDGSLATLASIGSVSGLVMAPTGALYIAEANWNQIRRVAPPFPGFSDVAVSVPSADGIELYQFDQFGRHLRTVNTLTTKPVYTFSYDSAGRLVAVADAAGMITRIEHDDRGAPAAIIAPFGQRTVLTTNPALGIYGYLESVANPAGEMVTLSYSAGGLLDSLTNALGYTKHFGFDSLGFLSFDQDALGRAQTLTRAVTDTGVIVTHRSAAGVVSTFAFAAPSLGGMKQSNEDASGIAVQVVTDASGRDSVLEADGTLTQSTISSDPRFGMQAPFTGATILTTPSGLASRSSVASHATLSDASNPLSLTKKLDSITVDGNVLVRAYDATMRRETVTSAEGRSVAIVSDSLGHVIRLEIPGVLPLAYSYDTAARIATISQGNRQTRLDYGPDGFLRATTGAGSRAMVYTRDQVGRITAVQRPDSQVVNFVWDSAGQVRAITPPGRPATTFSYTGAGQLASVALAGDSAIATRYDYDEDGRLDRVERADGAIVGFQFDAAGRLTVVNTPSDSIRYSYDLTNGHLTSAVTAAGTGIELGYDGPLMARRAWSGEVSGTVRFGHASPLLLTSIAVDSMPAISVAYDRDRLLTRVGDLYLTRSNSNGAVTRDSLGAILDDWTYDSYGELGGQEVHDASYTLFRQSYLRDSLGRVVTVDEVVDGDSATIHYDYDLAGRLVQVTRNGVVASYYEYDANGNRIRYTHANVDLRSSTDSLDRLLRAGEDTFAYNANGERTLRISRTDTTRFGYDHLGRLVSVELPGGRRIEYLLDPVGRRVGARFDGALVRGFLYLDQIRPAAELDGHGQVVSQFLYAHGRSVPDAMIRADTTYRIITDQVGSVRLVVNSVTGAVAQRIDYDEFGRVTRNTNPGLQPFGFAGGLYDEEGGLVHFGAREYDPVVGRWLTMDPAWYGGGSTNLYTYAENNPGTYSDPAGMCPGLNNNPSILDCPPGYLELIGALTGALLGGASGAGTGAGAGALVCSPTGVGIPACAAVGGGAGLITGIVTGAAEGYLAGQLLDNVAQMARASHRRGANDGPNSEFDRVCRDAGLNDDGRDALHRLISRQPLEEGELEELAHYLAENFPKYRLNP